MTEASPPTTTRPSTTIRLLHASFAVGIILFALVVHFFVRPERADLPAPPPVVISVLLGGSLAAAASSFVMRRRVPRRNTDESADLFWMTAATPALLTWAPLELGALLGVVVYMLSGMPAALVVAGIALAGMIALNPARLEQA